MASPYVGEIRLFGFNFNPTGWFPCDGRLLPIASYAALFSLIGTYYGGNGTNNFALPDLRSRVPLGMGTGPGLSTYVMGQVGGAESVALLSNNLPAHSHPLNANTEPAATDVPTGAVLAAGLAYAPGASNTALGAGSVGNNATANVPFNVLPPYLTLNFCIAYVGIFPSRN
jgi:microcystin-dependent protein